MKEQLNSKILAVHDKITNMVFEQIDKQLELVNISMNSTNQTTNQINSDCYKEMTKMSTARDNMPKWNNEATTTSHDYSLINNSQDTCTSQTIREDKTPHMITPVNVIFGSWSIVFSVLYSRYPICFSLLLRSAIWFCYIT